MNIESGTNKELAVLGQQADQEIAARKAKKGSNARFPWFLQTALWGVLLTLGMIPLVLQVPAVSQGTSDFCQDYIASARVLHGLAPYLPLHCWSALIKIPAPVEYDAHPPFSILLFLPLALLPKVTATMIWGFGCLAMYLLSGALLLRALGWLSLRNAALFVLGSLLWPPSILAENVQNFAQLLLLLLISAWLLGRKKHDSWAGWLLGLASLFKIWPVLLLVESLIQRRWRLALVGGVTIALGLLLTLGILGPGAYAAYIGPVQANEHYWIPSEGNISLTGAVARPLLGDVATPLPSIIQGIPPEQAVLLGEILAGSLLIGTLFFLWWCRRKTISEVTELLSQSLLITVSLLVFPITWLWGLITILLPCAMLLLALRLLPRPPRWWFVLLAAGVLPMLLHHSWVSALAGFPFASHLVGLAVLRTLFFGLPTLGLLLFTAAQALLLWWDTSHNR
jgi:hypothetical protein